MSVHKKAPLCREIMRRLEGAVPIESLTGEHRLLLGVIRQAVEDYIFIAPRFIDRDGVERNRPEHFSADRFLNGAEIWPAEAMGLNTEFVQRIVREYSKTYDDFHKQVYFARFSKSSPLFGDEHGRN